MFKGKCNDAHIEGTFQASKLDFIAENDLKIDLNIRMVPQDRPMAGFIRGAANLRFERSRSLDLAPLANLLAVFGSSSTATSTR